MKQDFDLIVYGATGYTGSDPDQSASAVPLAYVVSQEPHDSVRLDHFGSIVVRSRRSFETEDFAYSFDRGPGNGVRRDALQK